MVAGQQLKPVDILQHQQPNRDLGQPEAHGADGGEREASIDDEELVKAQGIFHIAPFEVSTRRTPSDMPIAHHAAQPASTAGSSGQRKSCHDAPGQRVLASVSRQDYNRSVYSPSMGLTRQGIA